MRHSLKRKLIAWLTRELAIEQARNRLPIVANIAPTTVLAPQAVIENFLGVHECIEIGEHSYIRGRLLTYGHGGRITIGQWCYLGERSEIWSMDSIIIGDRVLIGHDVNIHDGVGHSFDAKERHAHFRQILEQGHPRSWDELPGVTSAPIEIADDVSIGFGTVILKGVHIGQGCVIAPCSIVISDIPPGMIYTSYPRPVLTPISLFSR